MEFSFFFRTVRTARLLSPYFSTRIVGTRACVYVWNSRMCIVRSPVSWWQVSVWSCIFIVYKPRMAIGKRELLMHRDCAVHLLGFFFLHVEVLILGDALAAGASVSVLIVWKRDSRRYAAGNELRCRHHHHRHQCEFRTSIFVVGELLIH